MSSRRRLPRWAQAVLAVSMLCLGSGLLLSWPGEVSRRLVTRAGWNAGQQSRVVWEDDRPRTEAAANDSWLRAEVAVDDSRLRAEVAADDSRLPAEAAANDSRLEVAFSGAEWQRMSALGRILLLGEQRRPPRPRNFTVAVWRLGARLERRLLRSYGSRLRRPLQGCAVQNCRLVYTERDEEAAAADAVLVHLQLTRSPETLPRRRAAGQRWIFLSDESPRHAFLYRNDIGRYNGLFNWSMSYRFDADVPVPYGRTEPGGAAPPSVVKSRLVAVMGSNCDGSGRWDYVRRLGKFVPVDVYGRCGTLKCPGHYDKDCAVLADYKFYLAFENSHCSGYITEKVFWHALGKGAVPVVWGAKKRDYEKLLPPNSFIFVEDFPSVEKLATHLRFLNDTPTEYARYHEWRSAYHVLNEHGYFGSPIHYYCRICEALNYNSEEEKVYSRLDQYWGVKEHCVVPDKKMFAKA